MNVEQEIRAQIEKNKGLKLAVGEINNHLSVLEGLLRSERDDVQKQVNDAYQRGLEDSKKVNEEGCVGCEYADKVVTGPPCITCCNSYKNQWTAKKQDDKIEVGDEVKHDRGWVAVVTQIDGSGLSCVDKSGAVASYSDTSKFRKTGRHFDIEKILEEMKE